MIQPLMLITVILKHYVDKVVLDQIPTEKLHRQPNTNPFVPGNGGELRPKMDHSKAINERGEEKISHVGINQEAANEKVEEVTEEISDVMQDSIDGPWKRRKLLCARPFPNMRGHTAFLTFAHAGNNTYPDPREVS